MTPLSKWLARTKRSRTGSKPSVSAMRLNDVTSRSTQCGAMINSLYVNSTLCVKCDCDVPICPACDSMVLVETVLSSRPAIEPSTTMTLELDNAIHRLT